MQTEMGHIAGLLEGESDTQTPLQQKLAQLGKYLGFLAIAVCAVIFVIGLIDGMAVMEIFMTAVSLAVSAIPEGFRRLLPIVSSIGRAAYGEAECHHPQASRRGRWAAPLLSARIRPVR